LLRLAHLALSLPRHREISLRAPATLRRRFADVGRHEPFGFETCEGRINAPDGDFSSRGRFDFARDRDTVRIPVEAHHSEQYNELKTSKILAPTHLFHTSEEIARWQGFYAVAPLILQRNWSKSLRLWASAGERMKNRRQRLSTVLLVLGFALPSCVASPASNSRLSTIKQRGYLVCGVAPGVAGFSEVDPEGRHTGLDVDFCRAVSAAVFGTPDHVKYMEAPSVDAFLGSPEIDIVSRRLTWSLTREGLGLLFGPVTFYDGQGFLVSRRLSVNGVRQLSSRAICVEAGTLFEFNLGSYFSANGLDLKKVLVGRDEVADALTSGRCTAYTADVSALGALRSTLSNRDDLDILPDQISKEPLAQVVRQADVALFQVIRWTVFATINAEELGVSSKNVDEMLDSRDPDIRRLLGVTPGNGKALGLDERWAYNVIKSVGNYGEIFERNVGSASPIRLARGFNRLWSAGGLIFAPPLR